MRRQGPSTAAWAAKKAKKANEVLSPLACRQLAATCGRALPQAPPRPFAKEGGADRIARSFLRFLRFFRSAAKGSTARIALLQLVGDGRSDVAIARATEGIRTLREAKRLLGAA